MSVMLGEVHEQHWADWAERVAAQLAEGSIGPEQVRRAFGGMGSLNDLVICPTNGHHIDARKIDQINRRLDRLRLRVFRASQVR